MHNTNCETLWILQQSSAFSSTTSGLRPLLPCFISSTTPSPCESSHLLLNYRPPLYSQISQQELRTAFHDILQTSRTRWPTPRALAMTQDKPRLRRPLASFRLVVLSRASNGSKAMHASRARHERMEMLSRFLMRKLAMMVISMTGPIPPRSSASVRAIPTTTPTTPTSAATLPSTPILRAPTIAPTLLRVLIQRIIMTQLNRIVGL